MRAWNSVPASLLLCAVLLGAVAAPPARGDLIIGNLSSNPAGSVAWTNAVFRFGAPFTTSFVFSPVDLGSVNLRIATSGDVFARASLWSDGGGVPASEVLDLGTVNLTSPTFSDVSFAPASAFTLQSDSAYWVVLQRMSGTGTLSWRLANSQVIDPGSSPFAGIPANLSGVSSDHGATWAADTHDLLFSVHSVPEPGAAALLGLGALIGIGRRRRTNNGGRGFDLAQR